MKELIIESVNTSTNLDQTFTNLSQVLEEVRMSKSPRIGYVAGIITSDGSELIEKNIEILRLYTNLIRVQSGIPTFCASDVFGHGLYERLEEMKLSYSEREPKFVNFWRKVLTSGHVTDIFMTPGWTRSNGARDEHSLSKEINLRLFYINPLINTD
ncbi:MAG: hypothetical protein WCV81_02125 [Microgenomates group bacterium]|jgi:hypothetical protein